jgi:chemotaxis signal transduction protein
MTSYCVFNVGEKRIGIAMSNVREIIEPHLVVPTPIPLTPPFVHGLFNLRGQVLTCLDLSPFVGAEAKPTTPGQEDRAVIVERGNLRFATNARRIDTVEADPDKFVPLAGAALHPALDAEARTEHGRFQVIHLDRLEACLGQSLRFTENAEATAPNPEAQPAHDT